MLADLPAQDTKDEVHDEEGAKDNHRDKVYELPRVPLRVVDLKQIFIVRY